VFADVILSAELNARFDIVGIDPRGVAASTPVKCLLPASPPGFTLFPRTKRQFRQMVQHNRALGRSCLRETGTLLGHVDTVSVARDLEAVRIGLRTPKVNWFGLSYGTQIGANYAQLYPRRVRAMVFDGALEHSLAEVPRITDETRTSEDSFDRFAAWCRPPMGACGRGRTLGVSTMRSWLGLTAARCPFRVLHGRSPARTSGSTPRSSSCFKEDSVFGPAGWPRLATAIAQTRAGDASAFATRPQQGPTDSFYAALGIACMDWPAEVRNYAEMQMWMQLGRHLAPHLQGANQTWTLLRCIGWPVKAANPPRRLDVRGTPPILIVNATHDASTSYSRAHSLAAQIRGSVVLTRVGDGHTSYLTSPCARAAIDRYLIDGHPPSPDQVCS
jgi:pimeloyl-ACP methyl ester carboxylesterase